MDGKVTFLVWSANQGLMFYAGDSLTKALDVAKEQNVTAIDVWIDTKQVANVYPFQNA